MTVRLQIEFNEFFGDVSESIRAFLGETEISQTDGEITLTLREKAGNIFAALLAEGACYENEQIYTATGMEIEDKRRRKRAAKMATYQVFKQFTQVHLAWGALTGIRPTRLIYEGLEKGLNIRQAGESLMREFDVSAEKVKLLTDTVSTQLGMPVLKEDEFDLYVGIPFCPTRCHYCSFASYDADRSAHLMRPYIDALKKEILQVKEMCVSRHLRSVYIGGGTPTALTDELFAELLEALHIWGNIEFTVEAGRPDTITEAKLRIMQDHGVNRISINAQTTKQATLDLIGRRHTVEQLYQAFELVKRFNIPHINTDLIVGLPEESGEEFVRSVEDVLALGPDNITLHTLARKRGSVLKEQAFSLEVSQEELAQAMIKAQGMLHRAGYMPYYLYRQKYMSGSLENVGFARKGSECLYNVDNMEETADIVACGAGAVSKRIFGAENRIERAGNVKNILQYIDRIDEMLKRKEELYQSPLSRG